MLIEFNAMEDTVLKNFYGGEKALSAKMFVDERNKILYGKLEPGSSIGLHTHENGSEIIYVLEGMGKMLYDGEYEALTVGSCHYCPKGHSHSLMNDSDADLVFFAVVPQQ